MPTQGRQNLAELLSQKTREAIAEALKDAQDELTHVAEAAGKTGADEIVAEGSVHTGGIVGALEGLPLIGGLIGDIVDPLRPIVGRMGKLVEGVALGWALGSAMYPTIRAVILPLEHGVQSATTNEIWDPQTVAQLLARGLIETGHANDEAAGSGFDSDHLAHLASLATTRADVAMGLELLRRGALSDTFVRGELRHLGYTGETVTALMSLQRVLLAPPDLALARLRGNIDDNTMLTYAKELGIDDADMQLLVENTGEPPGLMQLLEAYRREFIDKARLERGIRQSRVRNEWIDVVERLRFSPMSVADAVRGVVENYITHAEGEKIAEQNGLTAEHWPILVESWGRPLAHEQMGSLVHRGQASRAQFDQAMRESDMKDKYIPLSFDLTRRLLPERLIVQAIHFNAIELQTGARMLLELGYDQQATSILLKLGLHEQNSTQHALTRAEVVTLYTEGTLSRAQARSQLVAMGYSDQNAGYVLTIADTQQHAKELRAETTAIRASYLANGIDAAKAETQLRGIGVAVEQAQHTIEVWNREKRRAARVLTETQIVKAATEGTITAAAAMALLTGAGYSDQDATILLRSHGVVVR